jgi:hypothetical protein
MRLGDAKFFNLFALLASISNPARADQWQFADVTWAHERSSHRAASHSFQIDLHVLRHKGRRPWTLLVARETWWEGGAREPFRDGRWVHLSDGARADVIKWFSFQEAALEERN